ncbi:MAG: sarcosine oxidase subunit delta [Roseovarius sp.]
MRITCPFCGSRDWREFTCMGDAVARARPPAGAPAAAWHAYLHLRDNPCGVTRELWQHALGCAAWLVVTRDTASHAVLAVAWAGAAAPERGAAR